MSKARNLALGAVAAGILGAATCCGAASCLGLAGEGSPEEARPASAKAPIDISVQGGLEQARKEVTACTDPTQVRQVAESRARKEAILARDVGLTQAPSIEVNCAAPILRKGTTVFGLVVSQTESAVSQEFFLERNAGCPRTAALYALDLCASREDCSSYNGPETPYIPYPVRDATRAFLAACEARPETSEPIVVELYEETQSDTTEVADEMAQSDATEVADEETAATEASPLAKAISEAGLFTTTQEGTYRLEDGTVLNGRFVGGMERGTFVGSITKPDGTKLSGTAIYTEKTKGRWTWKGYQKAEFVVAPYGKATITYPDNRTLAFNFEEDGNKVDYTKPASYKSTDGTERTLDTYNNATATTTDWYRWVDGRAKDQSCYPLIDAYRLDPKTYHLKVLQEARDSTRTDCPPKP